MLANPQWLLCFHAAFSALFRRTAWFDFHDVTAVLRAVVFENHAEVTPPDFGFVPGVLWGLKHALHVEVFNEYGVALGDVEVRELVFELLFFLRQPSVHLGDAVALLLPVV